MLKRKSSVIHKLHVTRKLSVQEVEQAVISATQNVISAGQLTSDGIELARIDIMKEQTNILFRGDKQSAKSLKQTLKKTLPKTKLKLTKTTSTSLTTHL